MRGKLFISGTTTDPLLNTWHNSGSCPNIPDIPNVEGTIFKWEPGSNTDATWSG